MRVGDNEGVGARLLLRYPLWMCWAFRYDDIRVYDIDAIATTRMSEECQVFTLNAGLGPAFFSRCQEV